MPQKSTRRNQERNAKKAWEQPIVFRPSEQDKTMLDWLADRLYLKPSQVLRQGLKRLYDAEKSKREP
jgi:hypothetical protein